jgi:D-glycero-D-manno-heptose 1,7-bisphosphate phosphatase
MCPHHPDAGCDCRKPNPGMLLRAHEELDVDLSKSYVVGDKYVDIETAHRVGATGILVLTGYGREQLEKYRANGQQPHFVVENLLEAVDGILSGEFK